MKVRKRRRRQKAKTAESMAGIFDFRLYVAGKTGKSITALTNLTRICQERLEDKCHITVIDILRNPQLAKAGQIVAIPTLVKTFSSSDAKSDWGPFQHRTRPKGIGDWFNSVCLIEYLSGQVIPSPSHSLSIGNHQPLT
jgi:hypothetical protein